MKNSTADLRINVRIPKDSDLKERIAAAVRATGIPESLLVLRAVEAVVNYIESNGQVTFPLEVQEQSAARRRLARTALHTAKIVPLVATMLAGCCALVDCELLRLDVLF